MTHCLRPCAQEGPPPRKTFVSKNLQRSKGADLPESHAEPPHHKICLGATNTTMLSPLERMASLGTTVLMIILCAAPAICWASPAVAFSPVGNALFPLRHAVREPVRMSPRALRARLSPEVAGIQMKGGILRRPAVVAVGGTIFGVITGCSEASASVRKQRGEIQEYVGQNPRIYVSNGMERFRQGDVEGSLREFDKAIESDPQYGDYLWQRGLSLYYAGEYEAASLQFLRDVKLNPRDTEESIWRILSQARQSGGSLTKARADAIKTVGEKREYMKVIYAVFQGERKADELDALIKAYAGRRGKVQDLFYLQLYSGLLAEVLLPVPSHTFRGLCSLPPRPPAYASESDDVLASQADGRVEDAKARIIAAIESPYAQVEP